jgi:hypothetical protein
VNVVHRDRNAVLTTVNAVRTAAESSVYTSVLPSTIDSTLAVRLQIGMSERLLARGYFALGLYERD